MFRVQTDIEQLLRVKREVDGKVGVDEGRRIVGQNGETRVYQSKRSAPSIGNESLNYATLAVAIQLASYSSARLPFDYRKCPEMPLFSIYETFVRTISLLW